MASIQTSRSNARNSILPLFYLGSDRISRFPPLGQQFHWGQLLTNRTNPSNGRSGTLRSRCVCDSGILFLCLPREMRNWNRKHLTTKTNCHNCPLPESLNVFGSGIGLSVRHNAAIRNKYRQSHALHRYCQCSTFLFHKIRSIGIRNRTSYSCVGISGYRVTSTAARPAIAGAIAMHMGATIGTHEVVIVVCCSRFHIC